MAIPDYVSASIELFNVPATSPQTVGSFMSGSGTYRMILFAIAIRDAGGFRTITGLTWNGVACTFATSSREQLADAGGQEVNLEWWYLIDPEASVDGSVVATLSANGTRLICHAVNIEGTGPLSFDVANTNEDDGSGSTAVSLGITTGGTDRLVLVASVNMGNHGMTWDSPLNEISDDPTTGGSSLPRMSVAYADQAASGLVTYTGTLGTSYEWGISGIAVYESAAPPASGGGFFISRLGGGIIGPPTGVLAP